MGDNLMAYSPFKIFRRDSDAILGVDGDPSQLHTNPLGRLKVSTQPGAIDDTTGSITAAQPVLGTPVAGGTVECDVRRASNLNVFCTGTFAGVNCTFEGSVEDSGATNWFGIQAVRTNANTVELATGVLSAQPAYAWELSVNALSRFRIRATARTSGTQNWTILPGAYATEPIPAIQTHAVTGTVTVAATSLNASASYGAGLFNNLISTATTNSLLIKTGATNLNDLTASNNGAGVAYVKLYNKASAPTVGTDVPIKVIMIPAGGTIQVGFGTYGLRTPLGAGVAITGGIANTDTTAVAASQVSVGISYT